MFYNLWVVMDGWKFFPMYTRNNEEIILREGDILNIKGLGNIIITSVIENKLRRPSVNAKIIKDFKEYGG